MYVNWLLLLEIAKSLKTLFCNGSIVFGILIKVTIKALIFLVHLIGEKKNYQFMYVCMLTL